MKNQLITIIISTLLIVGCSDDGGATDSSVYTLTGALVYFSDDCSGASMNMVGVLPEQTITLNDNGTLEQFTGAHCDDITISTQSECEEEETCGDDENEQCEWNESATQTLPYTQNGTSIVITGYEELFGEGLSITLSGDTMTWETALDGMCMQMIYENI